MLKILSKASSSLDKVKLYDFYYNLIIELILFSKFGLMNRLPFPEKMTRYMLKLN